MMGIIHCEIPPIAPGEMEEGFYYYTELFLTQTAYEIVVEGSHAMDAIQLTSTWMEGGWRGREVRQQGVDGEGVTASKEQIQTHWKLSLQ